jgi:hypothetical protein
MQLDLCKTLRVDNARRGKKPGQYAAWACVLVMFVVIFWQAQEALAAKSITPAATEAPAGTYHLDRALHALRRGAAPRPGQSRRL